MNKSWGVEVQRLGKCYRLGQASGILVGELNLKIKVKSRKQEAEKQKCEKQVNLTQVGPNVGASGSGMWLVPLAS
jgi:hypothetical protein